MGAKVRLCLPKGFNVFIVTFLRPEGENKAVIVLSAAAVQAEFEIGEGTVTLVKFSSGNKPPVKGLQVPK